jgi:uncharacterized protein YPO0396
MNKEEIIAKTEELVRKYDNEYTALIQINDQIEIIEEAMKKLENSSKAKIMDAVDENGKTKYSNETKRDVALQEEMQLNDGYQELKKSAKINRRIQTEITTIIEVLRMKMRGYELIGKLI